MLVVFVSIGLRFQFCPCLSSVAGEAIIVLPCEKGYKGVWGHATVHHPDNSALRGQLLHRLDEIDCGDGEEDENEKRGAACEAAHKTYRPQHGTCESTRASCTVVPESVTVL